MKADGDTVSPLHVQCSEAEFVACHMSTECQLTTHRVETRAHIGKGAIDA